MEYRQSDCYGLVTSRVRIHKTDPRYASLLSTLPGSHIKAKMQPLIDKAGVRKDLIFVETPNLGFCSANGTNMFTQKDAAICIAPGLYEADKDMCNWLMKHEISHIKYNDVFTNQLVPCICQLAASIFGMCYLSFFPALGLAYTVGFVSIALFSQWREAKADDFAIENSSVEELKGGMRFMMAMQQLHIEDRTTFWKRITTSASGNVRLDFEHPSTTNRLQKIIKALHAKNIRIDEASEKQKLNCGFNIYMANKKREIDQLVKENGGLYGIIKDVWSI